MYQRSPDALPLAPETGADGPARFLTVAQNDSIIALAEPLPFRLMLGCSPYCVSAARYASLAHWQRRTERCTHLFFGIRMTIESEIQNIERRLAD